MTDTDLHVILTLNIQGNYYRYGNWGSQNWGNLSRVTQLVRGGVGIPTQVHQISQRCTFLFAFQPKATGPRDGTISSHQGERNGSTISTLSIWLESALGNLYKDKCEPLNMPATTRPRRGVCCRASVHLCPVARIGHGHSRGLSSCPRPPANNCPLLTIWWYGHINRIWILSPELGNPRWVLFELQ